MPSDNPTAWEALAALPGSALLRIFQLVSDACPPEVPGTCWVAPVCKQWRDLACSVKGLRVVYQREQQQAADSFCAWLRRYVRQVVGLAITSSNAGGVAAALAEEAAAAAGGRPLRLQRLVITDVQLLDAQVCHGTLQPLLAALPHLQHLHLAPLTFHLHVNPQQASAAAASLLAPLQHSTGLTSLLLVGPKQDGTVSDEAHAQLLSKLPPTLRSLDWHLEDLDDPRELSFRHLTALTHLRLEGDLDNLRDTLPDDAFTSLRQLRRLELWEFPMSEEGLVAHKEQLVALADRGGIQVLDKLTRLQALDVDPAAPIQQLLQQAPPLRKLTVYPQYVGEGEEQDPSSIAPWDTPSGVQHCKATSQLQALELQYGYAPQAAPTGLCAFTQLKQLELDFASDAPVASVLASWAGVLAGLVNLEVLSLPGVLTEQQPLWLTGLTRLVVLDVIDVGEIAQPAAAIAHISRLLAPDPGSSNGSSSSSSSRPPCMGQPPEQVRVVCFWDGRPDENYVAQLYRALVAAVLVLPPHRHLFRGSWRRLQRCGVELWPAPVAARLQQLQIV